MYSLRKIMKIFILVFPMILKSLMGLGKLLCNVPHGTTQGWVYLKTKETYS
jgi:hypothetical protein